MVVTEASVGNNVGDEQVLRKGRTIGELLRILAPALIVITIGLLVGRAVLLMQLLPFVLPFYAVVRWWKPSYTFFASCALLIGASTISMYSMLVVAGMIVVYSLLTSAFRAIRSEQSIPIFVFIAAMSANVTIAAVAGPLTWLQVGMSSLEATLSLVITFIYFQSMTALKAKRMHLRHEEMICIVLLLSAVLTGLSGWMMFQVSLDHAFSRYFVLLFAYMGGATIGATAGVIMGLVLSLANVTNLYLMSLLAFSGLLGGLLKEAGRGALAAGLMLATILMALYADNQTSMTITMVESLVAVTLFFFTPKLALKKMASYIPGTRENEDHQQTYARNVRDVTAEKVAGFSSLFLRLSESFSFTGAKEDVSSEKQVDYFLSDVTKHTCQSCFKKQQCWAKDFEKTYGYLEALMKETEEHGAVKDRTLEAKWKKHCMMDQKTITLMQEAWREKRLRDQLQKRLFESQRFVADQLIGVSQVMDDFAKDIKREVKQYEKQEQEVLEALERLGITIEQIEIFRLDPGEIDIDMTIPSNAHGEAEKMIAPVLTGILNETVIVRQMKTESSGACRVLFSSTKSYIVHEGVAHAAKNGTWISGDSYSMMAIGRGKHLLAISDGMGNGERAHEESKETIHLLTQILQSGIEETIAIKSINSILSLRTTEEVFATLDLAMIDLQDARARFLKVGSTPSFIKRGQKVIKVEASNLPIGLLQEVEVDVVTEQMKAGDLLVMLSDGVYESPSFIENADMWLSRMIRELTTTNPQDIADILLERIVRECNGTISDDMTIVVARIDHYVPAWATVYSPQLQAHV
ncbi:stage II sporulation protein E [Paenalkalicoccus suaedae]|uniref:Stage II sporulation protein E n=1 Tax=Paenalkalicoccus suaedae TaxID=2592382 RepID=A0A859FAL5_9BACI|nr:stage II sporulation protein E [Paenalkalicoccus suaedae]QKS69651.1 stage II sporulation protein E [Paenalkalicoccus suaedae]